MGRRVVGCGLAGVLYNSGMGEETKKGEPLTLEGLVKYTQETLLPAFGETLKNELGEMKEDMNKRFECVEKEIAVLKDPILKKLDENTQLLKDLREGQEATSTGNARRDEAHDELDKRVVKLEKKAGIVPAVAS